MLKKLISGGQTGADRAALDAALEAGFPCGGYCPAGRLAEDGPIDTRYPFTEIAGGYAGRTEKNVIHSDGTVLFYDLQVRGGTRLTRELCQKHNKPHLLINLSGRKKVAPLQCIQEFITENNIEVLNIAGPRASESPAIYAYVLATMKSLLNR